MGGFKDKEKQKSIVRENFKNYVEKLGRVPSYNEMRKTPVGYKYLSASSIERNFGSYTALLEELGLNRNTQPNQYNDETFFTNEEIINAVHKICKDNLCYFPGYYHLNKTENMPGIKAVKLHFGSWYDFLVQTNIIKNYKTTQLNSKYKSIRRFVTMHDDHVCDSLEESIIDLWLQKNNINHLLHSKYPDSNKKCDFYIPHKHTYIEYIGYFGVRKNEHAYEDRLNNKIEHAKKYGLNLIIIRREDLPNLNNVLCDLLTDRPLKTDSN